MLIFFLLTFSTIWAQDSRPFSVEEVSEKIFDGSKHTITPKKNAFTKPIDTARNFVEGPWNFLIKEDNVFMPNKVLHPDYVNSLYKFDPKKFMEIHKADYFLDAKEKYYRDLSYSFVKKIYLHKQATLADWGGLNHPPIRKISTDDLKWIVDLPNPQEDSERQKSEFQKRIDELSDSELTTGNELTPFEDGKVLEVILDLVKNAEHTIWGSALLYACDESTKPLTDSLKEKAKAGLDVRIMVDWGLQKLQKGGCLDELKESGVKISKVRGIAMANSGFHVKLWSGDFKEGILLGANLIDVETKSNGFNHLYHDSGIHVKGPASTDIAKRFYDLWKTYHKKDNPRDVQAHKDILDLTKTERQYNLRGSKNYASWLASNQKVCRVVTQERHTDRDRVSKTLLEYLKTAKEKIWVASVRRKFHGIDEGDKNQNELLLETLKQAKDNNVKVEMLLNTSATPFTPASIPSAGIETVGKKTLINRVLSKAGDASASKSILYGSGFFEEAHKKTKNFRAWSYFTFNHNKNVIIDRDLVMTGSYNPMSERSTNDAEIAIFCQDYELNRKYTANMARDLMNSVAYPFRFQLKK